MGTFLHSPMLDELKSLEAMLMQRARLPQSWQEFVVCYTRLCESMGHKAFSSAALLCHSVTVPHPDMNMAPLRI